MSSECIELVRLLIFPSKKCLWQMILRAMPCTPEVADYIGFI